MDDHLWVAARQSGVQTWDLVNQTWEDRSEGLPAQTHIRVFEERQGVLWIGSNSGALYWWNETLGRWLAAMNLDLESPIISIESDQSSLYLGTSSGEIWVNDLTEILTNSSLEKRTSKLFIQPNPIRDSFEISGQNYPEIIQVAFYNIFGQPIYLEKNLQGQYLSSGLPAGLYLAEVQTSFGTYKLKMLKQN